MKNLVMSIACAATLASVPAQAGKIHLFQNPGRYGSVQDYAYQDGTHWRVGCGFDKVESSSTPHPAASNWQACDSGGNPGPVREWDPVAASIWRGQDLRNAVVNQQLRAGYAPPPAPPAPEYNSAPTDQPCMFSGIILQTTGKSAC